MFVMVISLILFFSPWLAESVLADRFPSAADSVVAGLSNELLKWAGRSDNWLVKILSMPGLYLQKLTTNEPDDKQLEVAIAAMKAVMVPVETPLFEGICDLDEIWSKRRPSRKSKAETRRMAEES